MYKTKHLVIFHLIGILLSDLAVAQNVESKVVNINQGPVRGYRSAQHGIFEFTGIPYATVPTGSEKFKAPLSGPVWTETFDANVTNIICPQVVLDELETLVTHMDMKEDCLIANVYVPDTQEINLSVVVTVHGGGYQTGWGSLATYKAMVAKGNYIAVNFNYRLGIHGFLCLGTEDIPGNAGMKDQVAALRWVKNNIANFGGNTDDITLTGYSAGSSAVELHMLSEATRGLFNKVVPESGAAVAVWSVQQDPTEVAKEFASTYLQFKKYGLHDLNDLYKTKPLEDLVLDGFNYRKDSTFVFVPCIERDPGSDNAEIFLKDAPVDILRNGTYNKLPMLLGFAEMEGIFRLNIFEEWKNQMNEQFSDFLPADLNFESGEQKVEIAQRVKRFYFGDEAVSNETMQNYIDYFGDVMFAYPTLRSVRMQLEAGNYDIYLYEYSFIDDMLMSENPYNYRGAKHTAQTNALIDHGDASTYSEEYINIIELIRKLWINFYKTGKSLTEPTTEFPQGWPASLANGSPHMDLDNPSILKGILLENRTKFWDEIYEQYYRKPIPPRSHGVTLITTTQGNIVMILVLLFLKYC